MASKAFPTSPQIRHHPNFYTPRRHCYCRTQCYTIGMRSFVVFTCAPYNLEKKLQCPMICNADPGPPTRSTPTRISITIQHRATQNPSPTLHSQLHPSPVLYMSLKHGTCVCSPHTRRRRHGRCYTRRSEEPRDSFQHRAANVTTRSPQEGSFPTFTSRSPPKQLDGHATRSVSEASAFPDGFSPGLGSRLDVGRGLKGGAR